MFCSFLHWPCFIFLFCPSLEAETWRMQRLLLCLLQTNTQLATCTCVCVRGHGTREHCVKAVTILSFHVRAQKFLVICDSFVSVILRLFRGIFLISTFLLDMVPQDIIKIIYFSSHCIKWRGCTVCKYLKCWGFRSSRMLRCVVVNWLPTFRNNQFLLQWSCSQSECL